VNYIHFGDNLPILQGIESESVDLIYIDPPFNYLPLVVLDENTDRWYVVPSQEVARMVVRKRRGQHTENPFKSATLRTKDIKRLVVADQANLRDETLQAVTMGDQYPKVREAMQAILKQSTNLASESRELVRKALK